MRIIMSYFKSISVCFHGNTMFLATSIVKPLYYLIDLGFHAQTMVVYMNMTSIPWYFHLVPSLQHRHTNYTFKTLL